MIFFDLTLFDIIGQLLIGWLIADLLGGIAHWIEDRVLVESSDWVGRMIVAPNRRHHRDPLAFLSGGWFVRNSSGWAVSLVVGLVWLLLFGPSILWAAALAGGLVSTEVHRRAHLPATGLVRVLQQIGIIQSAAHHAGHHRAPGDRRYCVLTDWLNPILDTAGVWADLETFLRRIGVITTKDA